MHYKILKEATFELTNEVKEIIQAIADYNSSLKQGSVSSIMNSYTEDSVLIPENLKPISGLKEIESVYQDLIKLIRFNDDSIINIIDAYISGDLGYVRSHNTHGSITEIKTGEAKLPIFRELWILKKNKEGKWKFSIYAYGMAPQGNTNPGDAVVW
ncbi:hypothetical protein TH53_14045 [Pedobacter lusitanus]|uniref:DUF4440 domain-containing protein n=1 Tax=Pedobacter lusitanus TaxID=1503925 RepID=A0A0D0F4L3_9SPHI|nr:hypothetical protein [Pedobacter lusitanus]KIO76568.1 hypothetical protein TH53_14045 [Pedobacter lusitanus]